MYSELFWEHARRPQSRGAVSDAYVGESTFPRCGDRLKVYLNIEDGCVTRATFEARGCAPVVAVASFGCNWLTGRSLDQVAAFPMLDLDQQFGGLPPSKRHAYLMFLEAVQNSIQSSL